MAWDIMKLPEDERLKIKATIERALSLVYSEMYDCKVTLRFEKEE